MRNQSLIPNLRRLQAAQYKHDQAAHQDIAGLPVPDRVTHFTLHFAKYVGQLAGARRRRDDQLTAKVVTDSFVIALAAANAMNVDLQHRIKEGKYSEELTALELDRELTFDSLVLKYAEVVGQMSKACEALDHMEDFPVRSTQERGVVLLLSVIRGLADLEGIDLSLAAKARWRQIEQKPLAGRTDSSRDDESPLSKVA
jgi:hypothetical protein